VGKIQAYAIAEKDGGNRLFGKKNWQRFLRAVRQEIVLVSKNAGRGAFKKAIGEFQDGQAKEYTVNKAAVEEATIYSFHGLFLQLLAVISPAIFELTHLH